MEFRFDIRPLLKTDIVRVSSNLVPQGFTGDRRSVLDAISKVSQIIDELGVASAHAQGLNKPVTTAQKLKNSDQIVYLLSEKTGKNGCVTGLLKVGVKNLYIFDANGETHSEPVPCVLDFYIHESRQRTGLGKQLFEHMLEQENYAPHKMAIDRPSEKLVAFQRKHYGLVNTIPQTNNFVIYQEFFGGNKPQNGHQNESPRPQVQVTASPNAALFGPQLKTEEAVKRIVRQAVSNAPIAQHSPMGRYGAKRPTCSMAEIIHSTPTTITNEPHSEKDSENNNGEAESVVADDYEKQEDLSAEGTPSDGIESEGLNIDYDKSAEEIISDIENVHISNCESILSERNAENGKTSSEASFNANKIIDVDGLNRKPKRFQHSKQHTGLKNISFNVGAAVMPSGKMEFDQEEPESFGVVKINRPVGKAADNTDAVSTVSSNNSEGLTEQGYFDLKFYHNKLW